MRIVEWTDRGLRFSLGLVVTVVLLAFAAESAAARHAAALVVLVRHAEPIYPPPTDAPKDPPLNVMGQERADALARLLSDAGIERVLSTDYRRTRETVEPLARLLGVEIEVYDPSDLDGLADRLRAAGGRVVVAGHSNTTPQLVERLGGEPGEPIDESLEFDRLYAVTLNRSGEVVTVRLRYGNEVPENWRQRASVRRAGPP